MRDDLQNGQNRSASGVSGRASTDSEAGLSRPAGILTGLAAAGTLLAAAYFTNRANSLDGAPLDSALSAAPLDIPPAHSEAEALVSLEPLVLPQVERAAPPDNSLLRVPVESPRAKEEEIKPGGSRYTILTPADEQLVRSWSRFPEVEEMLAQTKEFLRIEAQILTAPNETDKGVYRETLAALEDNLRYIRIKLGSDRVEPKYILEQTEWWSTSSSERLKQVLEK